MDPAIRKFPRPRSWNLGWHYVVYSVTEDLSNFEVLVPLYGARTAKPVVSGALRRLTLEHHGYYAGQYFKASAGEKFGTTPSVI